MSGKIDLKEMLMAKQMTEILDVPRDEVRTLGEGMDEGDSCVDYGKSG